MKYFMNCHTLDELKKEYRRLAMGNHYAVADKCPESSNFLTAVKGYTGAVAVNICPTSKKAQELADFWNKCYKSNGTHLFG